MGPTLALTAMMALYMGLSGVIPISLQEPIVDEPIFASSAFEYGRTGVVMISNLAAPNAIFDTVWGGFFAGVFGATYESLRLSSVVLTAISAPFMYLLCRSLGVDRAPSILGSSAYLLAPLAISLSFTFHTDAHAMALIVIAAGLIAHGLSNNSNYPMRDLILGSMAISAAYLSRPQALVLVVAALATLWIRRTPAPNRLVRTTAVIFAPGATFAYILWWTKSHHEPFIRALSRESILQRDLGEVLGLGSQTAIGFFLYMGLFTLPLIPIVLQNRPRRSLRVRGALAIGLSTLIGALLWQQNPFSNQQWLTLSGLGGVDRSFLGSRPPLVPAWIGALLVITCVASAYFWLSREPTVVPRSSNQDSRRFITWAMMGYSFTVLLSALALQASVFDRYWLPTIPLVIALAISLGPSSQKRLRIAAGLIAALGMFGIVGTYDAFRAYEQINDYAYEQQANITELSFDGGASWAAATFGLYDESPKYILDRPGPYWVKFYAINIDPEYGLALEPLEGYTVVDRQEFDSVLHLNPTYVFLLHRPVDDGFYVSVDDF